MSLHEIATYSQGDLEYTLYEEAASAPATVAMRVLNHKSRVGVNRYDLNAVLLPHDVTVLFHDPNGDLRDRLTGASTKQFFLKIERDSVMEFQGPLVPDLGSKSHAVRSTTLQLTFSDGIELLKDVAWDQAGLYLTWAALLRQLFDQLGYELPIRACFDIEADGVTSGATISNHRTNMQGLLDRKPTATYHDVLKEFLRSFKAHAFQEDGYWWVRQYGNRDSSDIEEIAVGGVVSTVVASPAKTITKLRLPSNERAHRGIHTLNRKVLHSPDDFAVRNGQFLDWDGSDIKEWDVTAAYSRHYDYSEGETALEFNFETMNAIQTINHSVVGAHVIEINLRAVFEINQIAGTHDIEMMMIRLEHHGHTSGPSSHPQYSYVDSTGAVVTTPLTKIEHQVVIPSSSASYQEEDISKTITFATDRYFNGFVKVYLVSGNNPNMKTDNGWVIRWYKADLKITKSAAKNDFSTYDYPIPAASNDCGAVVDEEVYLSDLYMYKIFSDFEYYDGSAWQIAGRESVTDTNAWKSSNHPSGDEDFNEVIAENFIAKTGEPLRFHKLHVAYSEQPKLHQLITMNLEGSDETYLPMYIERTASEKQIKLYVVSYP